MDETKRLLMEEDLKTNNGMDSDDDRMDFIDPENEEIADKISRKFKKK